MDFEYNDKQKMIVDTCRKIGKSYGPDYWLEKEENHKFPREFQKDLGTAGFLGFGIPEEHGGNGMGLTEGTIAFQELCADGGGLGPILVYLLGVVFGGFSLLKHGNREQKEKYLSKIALGEMNVCLSLTEFDAGMNTLNIKTFAKKEGSEYVINGSKWLTAIYEEADAMILVARTTKKEDSPKKAYGLSLFLLEIPNQAIKFTSIPLHGINYIGAYELDIDNLRVPKECLLGEEGEGWSHILDALNPERIIAATGAIGTGRLAIKKAAEYANQRKVFNNVIGAYQGIQFPLASAYAQLECAWLATLKAAVLYDQEAPQKKVGDIANIAKYSATEAGIRAIYHAMQTLGGYGYTQRSHIERWWREVQLLRLSPVTQQMCLNYTAEHILGLPRSY